MRVHAQTHIIYVWYFKWKCETWDGCRGKWWKMHDSTTCLLDGIHHKLLLRSMDGLCGTSHDMSLYYQGDYAWHAGNPQIGPKISQNQTSGISHIQSPELWDTNMGEKKVPWPHQGACRRWTVPWVLFLCRHSSLTDLDAARLVTHVC